MSPEDRELTVNEAKAIRSLERLAMWWPRTLTLASMGGRLCVVYTDDDDFANGEGWTERSKGVLSNGFDGIPNTGGDW